MIGAAATLVWVAAANSLPGEQARPADWSQPKTIGTPGITANYPRGWHATIQGGPSLAFSSFALPADWWSEDQKTIPDGGVFVLLYTFGPGLNGLPDRPRHFELRDDDRHSLSCNAFEGWNVIFVDHGAAVQAFVGLGPGARKSDAAELLDRLTIRRSPPSLAGT